MFDSYSVLKVVPLSASAIQLPDEFDKENERNAGYDTVGGILKDTKHFWTHNGPRFNVINCKTGEKVASWCFGYATKDVSARVVCVDEISRASRTLPLLVIGVQSDFNGGTICIFDIYGSKVVRAISINKEVTTVHVVEPMCGTLGLLENFDGVLAVGTVGGDVILVDLYHQACEDALNSPGLNLNEEVNACQLLYLLVRAIPSVDLLQQRHFAFKNDQHICTHLNAYDDATPHFILKGPKGENRIHVNKVEVTVSALHYCLQLGVLFVGYNFGAWQMWDLINLKLIYTSPIFEDNIPVSHFALQEPSDDPRAFCYVWVVYTFADALHPIGYPVAVLYSLNYERKKFVDNYGILYQNLTSCAVRFQLELTLQDEDIINSQHGAYCLGLQSINTTISVGGSLHENQEESISLCCLTWNGWSSNSNALKTYMSVFDINQWYKAQMPSTASPGESETYMSHVCLSNILRGINSDQILNVRININTLKHFVGSQRLEEHYYPSSLAFQMLALTEYNVISINNHGTQRALLSHLETGGALALIKPTNYFQGVIELGLLPLFVETPLNSTVFEQQRDVMLSVALEQKLLGWLCRCALEWNNGSYSSAGCTLNFILNWGWNRAQVLKKNADSFCVSLFDYSGFKLDANTHNMLSNSARQLRNIATLFDHIVQKCFNSELRIETVQHQKESLQMTAIHLEVLLWLLNIGLLPECPLSNYPRIDEFRRSGAPYDFDQLIKYYNERRAALQCLSKEQISHSGSFLFIDNFITFECGGFKLQEQWQGDGGNGLYPPSSLQALLRTYLIENVDIGTKHRVILYSFLDIITTLDHVEYKQTITNLLKFPAIFHLPPSTIKITQGFWKLDHGDFISALELLLDPLVCSGDFKLWQHRVVLKALLIQEQYHLALSYLQVRRPALSDVNDICTILSLFISNSMIDDAFHFQRQNKYNTTYEKILQHFYKECDQRGAIAFVLQLPLTADEKECFTKYLHLVKHPKLEDLQMINKSQPSNVPLQESGRVQKEVEQPKPLSVFVHSSQQQIKYKSTYIHAKLESKESVAQTPRLICPRILEEDINEYGPSPCKRFKPSPRLSVTVTELHQEKRNASVQLHTPIIKRKIPKKSVLFKASDEYRLTQTPQSILKVHTLVSTPYVTSSRQESKTPDNLDDITSTTPVVDKFIKFGTLDKVCSFNVTARKPIVYTPRPTVHFDISKSSSEASLISNKSESSANILNSSEKNNITSDVQKALNSSEDTFYSPSASVSSNLELDQIHEISSSINTTDKMSVENESFHKIEDSLDNSKSEVSHLWPKRRRSYRASLSDLPVRSSSRLKKMEQNKTLNEKLLSEHYKGTSLDLKHNLPSKQKLRGRNSFSRNSEENEAVEDEFVLQGEGGQRNISFGELTTKVDVTNKSPLLQKTSFNELDEESTSILNSLQSPSVSKRTSMTTRTMQRISEATSSFNELCDQSTTTLDCLSSFKRTPVSKRVTTKRTSPRRTPKKTSFNELLEAHITLGNSPPSTIASRHDLTHQSSTQGLSPQSELLNCPASPGSKRVSSIKIITTRKSSEKTTLLDSQSTSQLLTPKRTALTRRPSTPERFSFRITSRASISKELFAVTPSDHADTSLQNEELCKQKLSEKSDATESTPLLEKISRSKHTITFNEELPPISEKYVTFRARELKKGNVSTCEAQDFDSLSFSRNLCDDITIENQNTSVSKLHTEEGKSVEFQNITEKETSILPKELSEDEVPLLQESSPFCKEEASLSTKSKTNDNAETPQQGTSPVKSRYSKQLSSSREMSSGEPQGQEVATMESNETTIEAVQISNASTMPFVKNIETPLDVTEVSNEDDKITFETMKTTNITPPEEEPITLEVIKLKPSQSITENKPDDDLLDVSYAENSKTARELHQSQEKVISLNENLCVEDMLIIPDLNTACTETTNDISLMPSLSDSSAMPFDDSENPLNATIINTCLLEDDVNEIEVNKTILMEDTEDVLLLHNADEAFTEHTTHISDDSSSFVNMVPVDLEMNIYEVPDDLSTISTERVQDPLQKIELDSNYNANSDDEYAKSLIFSEVQDRSMDSLGEINELDQNIEDYTISMSEIAKIAQPSDEVEIIVIESSSEEEQSNDSYSTSEKLMAEGNESSSSISENSYKPEVVQEVVSSPESEGLCLVDDSDSQPAKIESHVFAEVINKHPNKEEESQKNNFSGVETASKKVDNGVSALEIQNSEGVSSKQMIYDLNTSKDTMICPLNDDLEVAKSLEIAILDNTPEETKLECNIDLSNKNEFPEATNKNALKETITDNTTIHNNEQTCPKTMTPVEELKKSCSSSKDARNVTADKNLPTLKTSMKRKKSSGSDDGTVTSHDARPITRSRSKSVTDTTTPYKIEMQRDIFDITIPLTPLTSDISVDMLEKSEYKNRTSFSGKTNLTDILDKTPISDDEIIEENILKKNVSKAKTHLEEPNKSWKNARIVTEDTNSSTLKTPVKRKKTSSSIDSTNASRDVMPTTRSRSKSITDIATPYKTEMQRDIFDITIPLTPLTSDISIDILEKSDYMNRTSLSGRTNLTDILDKTPSSDDDANGENVLKKSVSKAKTPLRRSRRLSNSSTPLKNTPDVPTKRRHSRSVNITPTLTAQQVEAPEPERGTKERKVDSVKQSKSAILVVKSKSDYSTSRKLTRSQARLIGKTLDSIKANASSVTLNFDSSDSEDCNRGPDVEVIDPINLLDRTNFDGKPDPDEENVMQKSPASSVTGSVGSFTTRKLRSRSSSLASKVSTYSEATDKRKKPSKRVSDVMEGTSSRLARRSKSVDDAVCIGLSPKLRKTLTKAKKVGLDESQPGSISIAHRTRSKSLIDQNVQRSSRQQPLKLELSKIPESDEDEKLVKEPTSKK